MTFLIHVDVTIQWYFLLQQTNIVHFLEKGRAEQKLDIWTYLLLGIWATRELLWHCYYSKRTGVR